MIPILLAGLFLTTPPVLASTTTETQAQLEQELKDIEQQIAQYSDELAKTQTQKATLANKIKQLQTRQKALNLQIKETTLKLNDLTEQLTVTENSIQASLAKEQTLKKTLGVILRQINTVDDDLVYVLLRADGLSGFFNELQNYDDLMRSLKDVLEQNKIVRAKLADDQTKLEDQKSSTVSLLQIKSIQQQGLKSSLTEQNQLMTETKGLESNYQALLSDSQKRANEIRNRIYELFNVGKQINFGQAVEVAKWVAGTTGIRPAFLLAILTQESNLGKNVGTCNRVGDPPEKSWKVIMKPERDQEPFVKITAELTLDVDTTPVSCPMRDKKGQPIGWGGAMGPAQFIPSTWMGFRDKITAVTGKAADPWDIRDAFLAAAIKLTHDGANGTENGEWRAAMLYFSGSTNPKFRFYADNVLATAKQYQTDIEELK